MLSQCKYFLQRFNDHEAAVLAGTIVKQDGEEEGIDIISISNIDYALLEKVVHYHYGMRIDFEEAAEVWALLKVYL